MKKAFPTIEPPDLVSEACAWIAQLESGDMKPADCEALREWISRSPRHAATIRQLARMSNELNILSEMAEPIESSLAAAREGQERRWIRPRYRLASLAVVLLLIGLALIYRGYGPATEQPLLIATGVGEFREVALPDGSAVKVNTDTQLEVHYTGESRKLRLLRGEAYFDVAPNPSRPFVVYAGNKLVRAVGTAFLVRMDGKDNELAVSVVEGKVDLADAETYPSVTQDLGGNADADEGSPKPVRLEAGQRIRFSPAERAPSVGDVSPRELQRELSWQEGLLDFSDTPLSDVIHELERYSDLKVTFADQSLGSIRFGGVFSNADPQALFAALEHSYGIGIEYTGRNTVVLGRTEDQARP